MTTQYVLMNSNIVTVTAGTAKVGVNDSYQSDYEFANAYAASNYDKPWLEWRSSYNWKQYHDITLTFSGAGYVLCLYNTNFSYIAYASANHYLGYNYISKDYRGYFFRMQSNSIAFIIPAQTTIDGKEYFRIGSIVVGTISTAIGTLFYPGKTNIARPQHEVKTGDGAQIISKDGRMLHQLSFWKKNMNYAALNEFNAIKKDAHPAKPMVFLGDLTEQEKIYLVKRVPDFEYEDVSPKSFESKLSFREIW